MPSGTPTSAANTMATTVCCSVGTMCEEMISHMVPFMNRLVPRSPRKISRKCKACGGYFSFENTLEHYPTYCPNCRKRHKAEMKAKYGAGKKGKREDGGQ